MRPSVTFAVRALTVAGLATFSAVFGTLPARSAPEAVPAAKPGKPAVKPAGAITFTPVELDLAPGETYPVTLFVPSPTGKYHTGALSYQTEGGVTVHPDPRWPERIPPWGVKVFPKVKAAADASGTARVNAVLTPGGTGALTVTIKRPAVTLVPGIHQLRIQVTNPMRGRPLKGRIGVANPDRFLGDVTSALLNIPPGGTQEVEIPLPGAAPVVDEPYAFTYTLQTWAGYQEKKTENLKFPPQRPAADVPPAAR